MEKYTFEIEYKGIISIISIEAPTRLEAVGSLKETFRGLVILDGPKFVQLMSIEDLENIIVEEAGEGNYNRVYALVLLYLSKKYKEI